MYGKWKPKLTASLNLKTDGWNTSFLSVPGLFSGTILVSGSVCIHENQKTSKCLMGKYFTYMDPSGHTAGHLYRANI